MPKKKPFSLQDLTIKAVGQYVTIVGRKLIDPACIAADLSRSQRIKLLKCDVDHLSWLLYSQVPWHLSDRVATEVLSSIKLLLKEIFPHFEYIEPEGLVLNQLNIVANLSEVVINSNLSNIDLLDLPQIMFDVLCNNFHKMSALKVLTLNCTFGESNVNSFLSGVKVMSNLMSFSMYFACTDHILSVVCLTCRKLEYLCVSCSWSVTNHSITSMLNCRELRALDLSNTSVTTKGYAKLLVELPNIKEFENFSNLRNVLEYEHCVTKNAGPFGLQKVDIRYIKPFNLNIFTKLFPNLTHVSIEFVGKAFLPFYGSMGDISELAALDQLRELELRSFDFNTDGVKELLELKGLNIRRLHLEDVDITINVLIDISQLCPNLKWLVFFKCKFRNTCIGLKKTCISPFQNVEFFSLSDCGHLNWDALELLLSNCCNIKCIDMIRTEIGDETIAKLLLKNPMKDLEEFKIFCSTNLSMETVQLLMNNCNNLRVLSNLNSWRRIARTELMKFELLLKQTNVDLRVYVPLVNWGVPKFSLRG